MKHKGLIIGLMLTALIASVSLSGCATYGGLSKEASYSITYDNDDLIYGDIISYEKTGKVGKRVDSLASLKDMTYAEALQRYKGYDFILFPNYIIKYHGIGSKVTITVTGRLAKLKNAE